MKPTYLIRVIALILALYIPIGNCYTQELATPPEAILPSEQTYNEIQRDRPNLRAGGESELGGVDAPDPSEVPLKGNAYPIAAVVLVYVLYKVTKTKKQRSI